MSSNVPTVSRALLRFIGSSLQQQRAPRRALPREPKQRCTGRFLQQHRARRRMLLQDVLFYAVCGMDPFPRTRWCVWTHSPEPVFHPASFFDDPLARRRPPEAEHRQTPRTVIVSRHQRSGLRGVAREDTAASRQDLGELWLQSTDPGLLINSYV